MTGESDPWHAPRPGPMHWDWRCLTCGDAVVDHPSLWARLVGRIRARRDRHDDNVSLVAEGIKRWQLQNDVAPTYDLGLAEFVTRLLEQEGRLR